MSAHHGGLKKRVTTIVEDFFRPRRAAAARGEAKRRAGEADLGVEEPPPKRGKREAEEDQIESETESEAESGLSYEQIVALMTNDNNGNVPCTSGKPTKGNKGYLKFHIGKHCLEGSLMREIYEDGRTIDKNGFTKCRFHHAVYMYAKGHYVRITEKGRNKGGSPRGCMNLDHIRDRLNNDPPNLRLVPHELNCMRQSADKHIPKKKNRGCYRYGIPMHTFFIDKDDKRHPFRAPFSQRLLASTPEGRALLCLGYHVGTHYNHGTSIFNRIKAEKYRRKQARAVIAFLRAHWRTLDCCSEWTRADDLEGLFDELHDQYVVGG